MWLALNIAGVTTQEKIEGWRVAWRPCAAAGTCLRMCMCMWYVRGDKAGDTVAGPAAPTHPFTRTHPACAPHPLLSPQARN